MNKKLLIVANWKANKTVVEAKKWMNDFYSHWNFIKEHLGEVEIVLAAPYTLLHYFEAPHFDAAISSQDVSMFSSGPYTGEVPGVLLKDLGVEYCLLGHSERRKYFGETNETVAKKFSQALVVGITPIVCAQSWEEIHEEIRGADPNSYVLMYEPFSAISTNGQYHPESPEGVQQVLADWMAKLPPGVRFLYGGSVNSKNVVDYIRLPMVSGFVVGHASLEAEEFFSIIKKCLTPRPSS